VVLFIGAISLVAIIRFTVALRQWCPLFWSSICALVVIALAYTPVYDFVDTALGNKNFAHLLAVILSCAALYLLQDSWSRGFAQGMHQVLHRTSRLLFCATLALLVVLFAQGSYLGSTMRPEAAYADDITYVIFRVVSLLYCAIAAAVACVHAAQISTRAGPDERFPIKLASSAMGLASLSYLVSALVRLSPFVGSTLYANSGLAMWTNAATQGALIVTGVVFSTPTLLSMRSSVRTELKALRLHRRTKKLWLHATLEGEGVPVLKGHHFSAQASMHRMIVEIWDAHSSSSEPDRVLSREDVEFVTRAEGIIRAA
jgi:hypothetical protein